MLVASGFTARAHDRTWSSAQTKKWAACGAAKPLPALLKDAASRLEFVIDEGLLITEGMHARPHRPPAARHRRSRGLSVRRAASMAGDARPLVHAAAPRAQVPSR